MSLDSLTELFRPRIRPRKGKWIHLNTVVEEYGLNLQYLFNMLDLNGIVYTHQEPRNLSRIYLSEEWVRRVATGDELASFCLIQTQVRDDELSEKHLREAQAHQKVSPRKATPKQVRLLSQLSQNKHLLSFEADMLNRVLQDDWVTKDRASALIEYLIGSSSTLPDGTRISSTDGILNQREWRSK